MTEKRIKESQKHKKTIVVVWALRLAGAAFNVYTALAVASLVGL
jgi:hypothetical protein